MDNVSSFIDGSLAVGGMIAILGAFVWTQLTSDSMVTAEANSTQDVLPTILKKAA